MKRKVLNDNYVVFVGNPLPKHSHVCFSRFSLPEKGERFFLRFAHRGEYSSRDDAVKYLDAMRGAGLLKEMTIENEDGEPKDWVFSFMSFGCAPHTYMEMCIVREIYECPSIPPNVLELMGNGADFFDAYTYCWLHYGNYCHSPFSYYAVSGVEIPLALADKLRQFAKGYKKPGLGYASGKIINNYKTDVEDPIEWEPLKLTGVKNAKHKKEEDLF